MEAVNEFGQHFRTGNDGDVAATRLRHFGIVVGNGRGFDQHLHVAHVLRRMSHGHHGAERAQVLDHGRIAHVRSRDAVPEIQKDLGNAAHSGAADTDHMYLMDLVVHKNPWKR